jgi:hypothetical protein
MPEQSDPPVAAAVIGVSDVTARVRSVAAGLNALLDEATAARQARAEATRSAGTDSDAESAVCAWNHFENIPTFYNWNNRPR